MEYSPNKSSTSNVSALDAFIADSLNLTTLPDEIFDPGYLEDIASNSALLDETEHNIDLGECETNFNDRFASETRDGQVDENTVDPASVIAPNIHSHCMEIILSPAEEIGLNAALPNGFYNNAWTTQTSLDFLDSLIDVNQNYYYNSEQPVTSNYFSGVSTFHHPNETMSVENIIENLAMEIKSHDRNIEQIIETLLPSYPDSIISNANDLTRNERQYKNSGAVDNRAQSPFAELLNPSSNLSDTDMIEVASVLSNANNIPYAMDMYGKNNNLTSVPDYENKPQLINEEGVLNTLVSNPVDMPIDKNIQELLTTNLLTFEDLLSEDLTPYLNMDCPSNYLEGIDQVDGETISGTSTNHPKTLMLYSYPNNELPIASTSGNLEQFSCSTLLNANTLHTEVEECEEMVLDGTVETPTDASTSELCQNTTNKTLGSIFPSVIPEFNKENIFRSNELLKLQRRQAEENDGKRGLVAIAPTTIKASTHITFKTSEQGSSETTATKSCLDSTNEFINSGLKNITNKMLMSKSSLDRPLSSSSTILLTDNSSTVNANSKRNKNEQNSIASTSTGESACSRTALLQPAVAKMCEICGIRLKNQTAFLSHIKKHQISRRFSCYICNKRFPLLKDLQKHMAVSHLRVVSSETNQTNNSISKNKPRLFVCTTCDASFASPSHLNQHKIVHIQEKPFKCPNCDRLFGKPQFLSQHMKHCSKK